MKLYYSPGACSLSPHIALHEAGLAFEPVLASTKSHKLQDGTDYYGINPLGYVPMLELDDGTRLREGPAIVQYIADLAPTKNLAPANGTLPIPAAVAHHRHQILVFRRCSAPPGGRQAVLP
jgi:glutathione S-transferase